MTNTYTSKWFSVFLQHINAEQTAHEVRFVHQLLAPARFPTLIDLCCGTGRHAHKLAALGYRVIGIDRDPAALATARQNAAPQETYLELDMRDLHQLDLYADAVLCLWQSFGSSALLVIKAAKRDQLISDMPAESQERNQLHQKCG